ncbi:hypothetical protein [Leifsonia sp. Leaf336]|uniref:hypothetical protein n=1 Tax=Leifsonia sp. Leaf336 TaxID=1736341 RepID=UPI000A534509|nr:hypothetical protein [Leifsonia sp. Leaf336]
MSVPALRGPVPQSPGAPQKTITQLLTQWADLTNAAIAATGDTEDWYRSPIIKKEPWDPATERVGLSPCGTVGSKRAHQLDAGVQHDPFQHDPHPIADKLTAYWESEGFTVTRTIDWTTPKGWQSVVVRAVRPDGVYYGLTATNDLVSIHVRTECSVHPSIDDWALERSLRDLNAPTPTPSSPASLGEGGPDGVNPEVSATVVDPSELFRQFREDASSDASSTRAEASADDDGWAW